MDAQARRFAVILAIGGLSAWLWIRLGLYGFGLPVGVVLSLPMLYLAWRYLASGRTLDAASLLGSFGGVWAVFEAWTWLNDVSDPAVAIPGWSPVPLASAVASVIVSAAVAVSHLVKR